MESDESIDLVVSEVVNAYGSVVALHQGWKWGLSSSWATFHYFHTAMCEITA